MERETDDRVAWQDWLDRATDAVGLERGVVPLDEVLDLAAEVARQVARPMAPTTAFIAGVAVGRGADPSAVIAALVGAARVH